MLHTEGVNSILLVTSPGAEDFKSKVYACYELASIQVHDYNLNSLSDSNFDLVIICLDDKFNENKLQDLFDKCVDLIGVERCLFIATVDKQEIDYPLSKRLKACSIMAGFLDSNTTEIENYMSSKFSCKVFAFIKPSFKIGTAIAVTSTDSAFTLDDNDLIDTDILLEDEDLQRPNLSEYARFDCGVDKSGTPRACKNCTCGLAQLIDRQNAQQAQQTRSACGNCYKGDAFRCASCPYKGLPPFEKGEQNNVIVDTSKDILN
ncbi:hypothetical protein GJ496_008303 [Pomphorhynchus laevis]|nr:hypothetical protein GJ496_008303 [Pomphorhynchus laevis]